MRRIKQQLSQRAKASLFYELLAGGARTRLLESVVNFNLAELIGARGKLLEAELTEKLQLHPLRAKKWFFLLTREGFLRRKKIGNVYEYSLGPVLKELFVNDESRWWFFKQMTYSWQTVAYENFYEVLRGKPVNITYQWPPRNETESVAIEEWMTRTSASTLYAIENALDLSRVTHLLDIGGGEGTMACELAKKYPQLKITVYNLPKACELARNKIMQAGLQKRINVVEGDFLKDETFPSGCDLVLFSRVLCDWSPDTAKNLLKKVYDSINPGARVAICEAFQENNKDFSLAWEMRYVYWDEFETEVFKSSLTYKKILTDLGFKIKSLSKMTDESIYTVLSAEKKKWAIPFLYRLTSKFLTWRYERMQEEAN